MITDHYLVCIPPKLHRGGSHFSCHQPPQSKHISSSPSFRFPLRSTEGGRGALCNLSSFIALLPQDSMKALDRFFPISPLTADKQPKYKVRRNRAHMKVPRSDHKAHQAKYGMQQLPKRALAVKLFLTGSKQLPEEVCEQKDSKRLGLPCLHLTAGIGQQGSDNLRVIKPNSLTELL